MILASPRWRMRNAVEAFRETGRSALVARLLCALALLIVPSLRSRRTSAPF